MDIEIQTDYLDIIKQISERSGQTTEEVINSGVRFLIMIHCMPMEDQLELKRLISKTYPDIELRGLH